MSCGVGCRRSLDPVLLWLWCRPAAIVLIRPLAWEPPYASGAALEKAKRQNKTKQKNKKTKERNNTCLVPKLLRGSSKTVDFKWPCLSHPDKFLVSLQHSVEVLSCPQCPEGHMLSLASKLHTEPRSRPSPTPSSNPPLPGATVFIIFCTRCLRESSESC